MCRLLSFAMRSTAGSAMRRTVGSAMWRRGSSATHKLLSSATWFCVECWRSERKAGASLLVAWQVARGKRT